MTVDIIWLIFVLVTLWLLTMAMWIFGFSYRSIASLPNQAKVRWLMVGADANKALAANLPWPPRPGDQKYFTRRISNKYSVVFSWLDNGQQRDLLFSQVDKRFIQIVHREECVH